MKQAGVWLALIIAVGVAVWLAMMQSPRASAELQRFVEPGPLSPQHAYLGERCASCHEPTVGVTVAKCTACHANDERLLGRQPTEFHASVQECAACHVEHQHTGIRPLSMDHVGLARIGARTLALAASKGDLDSAATLKSIDKWFTIRSPAQLDATSAREVLNCAGCHDRKDPHFERFGADCAQCHGLDSWAVPAYQHPLPQSQACVQCHKPPPSHLMEHFSMISQKVAGKEHARVDECFECHNTTGWNDIIDVGFYKHH
jgi:hypothetical protein